MTLKRTCAAMQHHAALAQSDLVYRQNRKQIETFTATARLARRQDIIRIPVVVHVVYRRDEEDISERQIHEQIAVLNADFRKANSDLDRIPETFRERAADTLIEFGLAIRDPEGRPTNGITRTRTSITEFSGAIQRLDATIKFDGTGKRGWPSDSYLNLWVCNLGSGLLGYAQFPGGPTVTDGVVINYQALGTSGSAAAPFNKGRTATHEVGHWLNLLHIWGDDDGACTGSDNVSDTPNQAGPNYGAPTFPSVTCGNGPSGDMFVNFMDYVDDDAMHMFTKGQAARMDAALAGARHRLRNSEGLKPLSEPLEGPVDLDAIRRAVFGETARSDGRVFDGVTWV